MSQNIVVLYPSGHRRNTKVSPNSSISQTLEEVCKKEDLDAQKFSFLFQRKILDESLSWRYANVPNNAKLELVTQEKTVSETPVRIALQYEGGQRLQGTFLPSSTLMDVLGHWKNELSTMTPPEGQEQSILYLRQEITGNAKITMTTLKSLGIVSGSAVLRLSHKVAPQEEPLKKVVEKKAAPKTKQQEAPVKVGGATSLPPQSAGPRSETLGVITQEMLRDALRQVSGDVEKMDVESPRSGAATRAAADENIASSSKNGRVRARRPNSSDAMPTKKIKKKTPPPSPKRPDFSDFKFPEETAGMDIYSAEDEAEMDIESLAKPCDREVVFFDEKEMENREIDSEDPGDEFFELTIDDIRKMISELRALQTDSEEKPLVTARYRELQRIRSINQYPKIIIRVAFPNRQVLQGIFRPAETVDTLYDFVQDFLSHQGINFYLYTTPPKVTLKDKKSVLYDNHLSPASKVYFGLKDGDFDDKMLSEQCEIYRKSAADANLKLGSVFEMKSPVQLSQGINSDILPSSGQADAPQNEPSTSHDQETSTTRTTSHPSGARPKVPKWFKIGK